MKKHVSKTNILILFAIILVYSILCLTKYQYVRFTADSMLYFSLAEKYLTGNFQDALNGYWGPLLAWLIVPFLYIGFSDVFTINVLDLIFGILTITGTWILSFRFEISERIRSVLLLCLLPIVIKFSIVQPMDFLLLCILIIYLGIIFNSDYPKKMSSGVVSGFLGSLAYFTKAYAFPFFIVHFLIMNIFHYFEKTLNEDKRKVLRNVVAGFIVFFLISGAWISIISNKYGHFTFSTMRDTNFNAPGPEVQGSGLEFGVPVFTEGFFEPPNDTAFVVWEDPSYLRGKPWSAWQSPAHFKHFIKLTLKNIAEGLQIFEGFTTLSVSILLACILLLRMKSFREILSQRLLLYPLFTVILFSGGYILFHFEERYVWLVNILLLLMGGHLLTLLFKIDFLGSGLRRNILIVVFVISFVFTPSRFIFQASNGSIDQYMHGVSVDLKSYGIRGNIASNREYGSHDAWHKTFRLAYWLNSRYYGQAREGIEDDALKSELSKYEIDYYFLWGDGASIPQFFTKYNEVTGGEIPGLKVYSLKSPRNLSAPRIYQ